ncbi:hypothetical protein IQ60_27925 [Streptomyces europaeiscabiei]|nr:hypothetical protein IQ60_27925 [Streptomyces europaeiscabiei]
MTSHESWDRLDLGEQGHQLRDVVTVSAGQGQREREALAVDEDQLFQAKEIPKARNSTVQSLRSVPP